MGITWNPRWDKWRLILRVFLINMVAVPVLLGIVSLLAGVDSLKIYKGDYPDYFRPFTLTGLIAFAKVTVGIAQSEETMYCGLIWLLSASAFYIYSKRLGWKFSSVLNKALAVCVLTIPTIIWAQTHPIFLPVFFAGMTWGWLIYKTRSLWPAIMAHFFANLSIYILIHIAGLFVRF